MLLEIGGSFPKKAALRSFEMTIGQVRRPPGGTQSRILIIEDDQELLEPIASSLCAQGHYVRSTTRGSDFLRLVDLLDPDILITDVIMEDVDALEMIVVLRESRPRMKIIAISGNPHLLTLASKCGATHVLAKPFPLGQLNVLVKVAAQ